MTASPKFPNGCDKGYTLNEETRKMVVDYNYLLITPVCTFGDLCSHIDNLPEEILLHEDPENVYSDIKSALCRLTSTTDPVELPATIKKYLNKLYGYFSNRKSKDRFLKLFNRELEAAQTRLQNRKVAQARRNTYQKAQMLGTTLTNIGLDEFEEEFTNGATSAPTTQRVSTSASTTQVSPNAPTPIEKAT